MLPRQHLLLLTQSYQPFLPVSAHCSSFWRVCAATHMALLTKEESKDEVKNDVGDLASVSDLARAPASGSDDADPATGS